VVIKLFKGATRTALMAVSVTAIVQSGGITPEELVLVPATDAITKWLLDRYLGRNWRDKLQHELSQRRRELLVAGCSRPCSNRSATRCRRAAAKSSGPPRTSIWRGCGRPLATREKADATA